jgi:putative ABC transport system substrate-binding protein
MEISAKSASSSIPIVFPLGSDPVETGLVSNLERPGGNVTGMATMSRLQSEPRLALVRESVPNAKRVALMRHSANPALNLQVEASIAAAPALALEVVVLDFAVADEIEKVFETACEQRAQAVLPLSDPMALGNADQIGALSLKYKLPIVSPFREITDAGGLLSYGPDLSMLFRRSASLVDRILKGAKPGDLPIGKPSDFELGANLQTAKALNLTIPASIMSRATYIRELT